MEGIIYFFFAAFLLVNLAVGLYYSRGIKTFKAYAVGGGHMPIWVLAATIAATWATGSGFVSYIRRGFDLSLYNVVYAIVSVLTLVLVGVLSLRMREFLGTTSIAGAMGRLYGEKVAKITALVSLSHCVGFLAGQFKVFSTFVSNILNLDATLVLLTLGSLVILYSVLGGIKAIMFTDVLQFVIAGLFLPVTLLLFYTYMSAKTSFLPTHFIVEKPTTDQTLGVFRMMFVGLIPSLFQRCLVNQDLLQTRKAFFRAAICYAYLLVLIFAFGHLLKIDNKISGGEYLIDNMLKAYNHPAFKILFALVIMATALSTADSQINTSAILLAEFLGKRSLVVVRVLGIAIGCLSLGVVWCYQGETRGLIYAASLLYLPMVISPFILALLGFRSSQRVALISMVGSALVAIGVYVTYSSLVAIMVGMLANVVLMFVLHYGLGEPGGWVGIKDKMPLIAHAQLRRRRWASRWASIRNFDLTRYLKVNLPHNEGHYIFFGLYVMTFVFGSTFFLPREVVGTEGVVWLLGFCLLLNSITMTYPIWPEEVKRPWAIAPLWSLSVGYALFYIGMLWLLLGGFHIAHVALLIVNLVLGMLLFRRKLLGAWLVLGSLMAVLSCRAMAHTITLSGRTLPQFGFIFAIMLSVMWALYAHQQKRRLLVRRYLTLRKVQRSTEDRLAMLRMSPDRFAEQIIGTQNGGLEIAYQTSKARHGEADELTQQIDRSAQYFTKLIETLETQSQLQEEVYPLPKFLDRLYDRYAGLDEAGLILYNRAKTKMIKWDKEKVYQLLYQTYRYLHALHPDMPYSYLHVRDTHLKYPGFPKPLPAVAFALVFNTERPNIVANYTYTERADDPYLRGNRHLREMQVLSDSHYGHLELGRNGDALIVLPVQLGNIRPKMIEDEPAPQKVLDSELLREAKISETSFWAEVVPKKQYNIPDIERVVHFMKTAHQHQTRKNNAPYYTHTLTVAKYVSQYDGRPHLLTAALLHDVVEDTHITLEEVGVRFGDRVAQLVKLLSNTKLDTFKKYKDTNKKAHAARLAENLDAILIKTCDRLHNLETLSAMPRHKQQAKAKETLAHYLPVIKIAGFAKLAQRLEKMAKKFL